MVDLRTVVNVVLYLIVVMAVFGLLFYAIEYIGRNWGGEGGQVFVKFARTVLVVLGVFVCIGLLMALVGQPLFRW